MSQIKEQDKTIARHLSKTEINNMPDREFKIIVIKILTGLEKTMEDFSELFTKEKTLEKNQSEKRTIIEIKNTLNGINSRLGEAK